MSDIDRSDVAARLDKMMADLAEVRRKAEEAQQTVAEIEATRREIEERKAEIEVTRDEIRERAATVEALHEEAVRSRKPYTRTRQKAEEVTTRIEALKERREAIVIPAPDILDTIGAGVTAIEKPFADVSRGLRRKAEEIRPGPRKLPEPIEITGIPGPGQPSRGPDEMIGLTLRAGASAFDAFTMIVRPVLVGETIVTTAKIVVDAPTRKAFLRSAAEDPAGFGADIIGGAIGGYGLGKAIGRVRQVYTRRRYLTDLPDEAFLVPEEAAYAFPQRETMTRTTAHDYLRKVGETGVVDDFDTYRGPLTFDKKIIGFRRTGHDLIPELVPDQAPTSSIYRPGTTTFIETVPTFRPGVPYRPRIAPTGAPLAFTTGLGILSSLKADPSFRPPEEALALDEEVRIMTGRSTRQRRRPRPTEPGFIEAPTVIEFGGYGEKERDWIEPMYKPPKHVQRYRQRQRFRPGEITATVPEVPQRPRDPFFGWPTTYRRPPTMDPRPVYRPEMAKTALKRGRGSWRLFGEYRTYLKGDPLKMLEGI